jgi:hypothetical protein
VVGGRFVVAVMRVSVANVTVSVGVKMVAPWKQVQTAPQNRNGTEGR